MYFRKRLIGLVLFCIGLGMLFALFIQTWAIFIAIGLIAAGLWALLIC